MEGDHTTHKSQAEGKSPPDFSMTCSLSLTSDPVSYSESEDDKNNMNDEGKNRSVELESSSIKKGEEHKKVAEKMENKENISSKRMTKSLPLLADSLVDHKPILKSSLELEANTSETLKCLSMKKGFQMDTPENETRGNSAGELQFLCSNNNNYETLMSESKAALLDKLFYGNDPNNWKRERGPNGDCDANEDFRLQFPWKRIAYIGVLLVLGVTCAILALMKICGGAEWMNTATFAVIIMGTVMLLPPGLYYGRILICISCRCKGYTLWDVPAGPFG